MSATRERKRQRSCKRRGRDGGKKGERGNWLRTLTRLRMRDNAHTGRVYVFARCVRVQEENKANEEGPLLPLFSRFFFCLYFSVSFRKERERAAQGCTVCHSVGYTGRDSKTIFQLSARNHAMPAINMMEGDK